MGYGPVNVPGSADGGDISNAKSTFSEASSRANITSGEKLSTIFGKIKKWYTDLKTVAWTGSYSDLKDTPESMTPKAHATNATTYGKGDASNYGHLKLSDSTASTSSTTSGIAATPKAVKAAYDKATEAQVIAVNMHRTATIVVAAYNSFKDYADYVCDGTADQTEINSAISALPSTGGKVLLLEGTYNISGSITLNKANVTLEGVGNATILNRAFNGDKMILVSSGNCVVSHMALNGRKSTYTSSNNYGIQIENVGASGKSQFNIVTNVAIDGCAVGLRSGQQSNGMITNCRITNCNSGIEVYGCISYFILNNMIASVSNNGILCDSGSSHVQVCGNDISDVDTGIALLSNGGSVTSVVAQNTISSFDTGIHINSWHNKIYDNLLDGSDMLYTIRVTGGNNDVHDNRIFNKDYVNEGSQNKFRDNIT